MKFAENAAVKMLDMAIDKLPPDHMKALDWFLEGLQKRHVPEAHFLALKAAWMAGYQARGGKL